VDRRAGTPRPGRDPGGAGRHPGTGTRADPLRPHARDPVHVLSRHRRRHGRRPRDINDFDETHPGPWEWDVKRLAASLEVAARHDGFSDKQRRKMQLATVRSYQDAKSQFAGMHELDLWYASADADQLSADLVAQLRSTAGRRSTGRRPRPATVTGTGPSTS